MVVFTILRRRNWDAPPALAAFLHSYRYLRISGPFGRAGAARLMEIGPMRPGSLTRQYKDPQHHTGAYWQISYTRRMKSRTEYVRQEWVKEVRRQTVIYKRFKRLVDQWIDLSIEHSRLTMQMTQPKG